jgi:hypothetical protein
MTFTTCRYGAEQESIQAPGDDPSHNDSVYFNFVGDEDSGVFGGVIRIGLRPNDGYSELSLVLPLRAGGVLFRYQRSPLERDSLAVGSPAWSSGAMRLENVEPTRRWRLQYGSDEARVVDDLELFAERPGAAWRSSPQTRCEFDLDWRADFPMHVLSPGGNLMPGKSDIAYGRYHYEQFGSVEGTLQISDESFNVRAAPTFRDHSWGPRVWESAPNQDFVTVYLDDGRRVAAVCNRLGDDEDMHGVVWSPGAPEPLQLDTYELHSDYAGEPLPSGPIGWTFGTTGERLEVTGEVEACMPLRVGREPVRIAQTLLSLGGNLPGRAKTDLTRPIAPVAETV